MILPWFSVLDVSRVTRHLVSGELVNRLRSRLRAE